MNLQLILNLVARLGACVLCILVLSLSGCKENPGTWPADKVSAHVASSLELTGLTLTPSDKGLKGSGTRADGETITVVVTQDPSTHKISWEAKGDRGFVENGSYSLL